MPTTTTAALIERVMEANEWSEVVPNAEAMTVFANPTPLIA